MNIVLFEKGMKKADRIAWFVTARADIFKAHNIRVTADDMRTESRPPVGYCVIDGLDWPLWESKYTLNPSPVYVSDSLTGKMKGVPAVSTDCRANPVCIARMKDKDSICAHCFAAAFLDRYTASGEHAFLNTLLLVNHLIPADLLPVFGNVCFARIESSGDVGSVVHALNYLNMIKLNRRVVFGWWSKNINIVDSAIEMVGGKPRNMIFIQSSCYVNKQDKIESPNVDKVFTVYSPSYIADHDITVNCGARSCVRCRRCYGESDEVEIVEQLK
jgi:hypothetical protein